MLTAALRRVGSTTLAFLTDTGGLWRLSAEATSKMFLGLVGRETARPREMLFQTMRAGYASVPLVCLICVLVGMIMALQGAYQLRQLGAIEIVADLVGVSITRELAPLLTAIIVTGRYGSAIAAELGTMRVSQEVDALQVMGIDPTSYLVVPRLLALVIAMPCLTIFADALGILGGLLIGVGVLEMGFVSYLTRTVDALVLQDIFAGIVKALVFGAIIGFVGCYEGLTTRGGPAAVGRSTTSAVVRSIVLIIGADLLVTAIFFLRA